MFAYMSLIYYNQTPSGIFTRRFWSTANKSIKWTVGECLYDLTHNGNCEWRAAGAILNEVIISVHVCTVSSSVDFSLGRKTQQDKQLIDQGSYISCEY